MTHPPLDTPLWKFSLAVYAAEGVQDECLALQEQYGVDVNLLLLCAYLGAVEGAALSQDDIAQAAEKLGDWHEIVRSLRAARRALKPWATAENPLGGETQVLRARVKAAELETERLEQAMLWEWSRMRASSWHKATPAHALATNLLAFLVRAGVPEREAGAAAPNLRRAAIARESWSPHC